MKNKPTENLFQELGSENWQHARDALLAFGVRLSGGNLSHEDLDRLAERLRGLASHRKWEVRKAVAECLLHLNHELFPAIASGLVQDDNAYVRDAARRVIQQRDGHKHVSLHHKTNGDEIRSLLDDVERRLGSGARKAALRTANKMHAHFVREIYHELIKIISPLDAGLLNLQRECCNAENAHIGEHIARAQKRIQLLNDILENLRDLTSEGVGKMKAEVVAPVIRDAADLVRGMDETRKGNVEIIELPTDAALTAHMYRSRVIQALINILTNAVEACAEAPAPRRVTIGAASGPRHHVTITVEDTGSGMDAEALNDCMRLYATRKATGMGFGLPIARKIIEADHSGTLEIKSEPGKGTKVLVVFPIKQEPEA
jgi:signal transduction histidine kinase